MINYSNEILRVVELSALTKSNKVILNNISFNCSEREFLVIIGKNGHGKTTLSLSIANLLNKNVFKIKGEIFFKGQEILSLSDSDLNLIRQKRIGYVPQNPFSSFNPTKKIKAQFEEQSKLKNISFDTYIELMKQLDIGNFDLILNKYPFELSGGILQRLSAVRCLAVKPELIIADEPTSALDKPVSNLLLSLFYKFVKDENKTLILITQDLFIAEVFADRIAFLNSGEMNVILSKEQFFASNDSVDLKVLLDAYQQLKI